MLRVLVALLVALLALVVPQLYDRAVTLGAFRSDLGPLLLRARSVGDVKLIPDTINAEDLHLDIDSGLIFAAAQDEDGSRAKWFPPLVRFSDPSVLSTAKGGLRVIDPKTFTSKRLKLENFDEPWCTHGIDIFRDPDIENGIFIHAVNHAPNPEYARTLNQTIADKAHSRIEIFFHYIGTDVATHVRTVSHPLIATPNDIYSTGPFSFYVTNDHYYREGHMRLLEDLGNKLAAGWTTVVHVDFDPNKNETDKPWAGVNVKLAHHGLHNNNGLGHTAAEGEVMVVDAAGGIAYFANRREDNQIEVFDQLKFESTIDNPSWFQDPYPEHGYDASGMVNAGLAQGIKLAEALDSEPIPSLVYLSRGRPSSNPAERDWNTTLLYADNGTTLRSSSAAVLVAIDPKENDGKKQAWLFTSGFASSSAIAVKVDL